jgi:hypothetical protein
MSDYNNGQVWGWNGGDCPVHPETVVQFWTNSGVQNLVQAKCLRWGHTDDGLGDIIAFQVYVDPKVVWVNEYKEGYEWTVYSTKDEATESAAPYATRIAVKYVEVKDE